MPFCVLLEAALQPCGWLASAVGSAVPEAEDLSFRNLDGTGTLHRDIAPLSPEELQTFETTVTITGISKSAGMIIESFDVQCAIAGDGRLPNPVLAASSVAGSPGRAPCPP